MNTQKHYSEPSDFAFEVALRRSRIAQLVIDFCAIVMGLLLAIVTAISLVGSAIILFFVKLS